MKIKWIGGERDVPGVGRMRTGMVVDMDDAMARDLVRQGLAKKYKAEGGRLKAEESRRDAAPTE